MTQTAHDCPNCGTELVAEELRDLHFDPLEDRITHNVFTLFECESCGSELEGWTKYDDDVTHIVEGPA